MFEALALGTMGVWQTNKSQFRKSFLGLVLGLGTSKNSLN